jgi:hypothetical protein
MICKCNSIPLSHSVSSVVVFSCLSADLTHYVRAEWVTLKTNSLLPCRLYAALERWLHFSIFFSARNLLFHLMLKMTISRVQLQLASASRSKSKITLLDFSFSIGGNSVSPISILWCNFYCTFSSFFTPLGRTFDIWYWCVMCVCVWCVRWGFCFERRKNVYELQYMDI